MTSAPQSKVVSISSSAELARLLWAMSGFLLGTLFVWSFLAPADATSVFEGATQPQNLFWLLLCTLVSGAVVSSNLGYVVFPSHWCAIVLGLCGLILVTVFAGKECDSRTAWYGFWQCVSLTGAYYCTRSLLAGPQARAAALLIIVIGCLALAAHGVYQVTIELPANRAEFEKAPEAVMRLAGFDAPEGSPMLARFRDRLYSPEPFATFALANSLAVVLSGGLVLAIGLSVEAARNYSNKPTTSVVFSTSAAIAAVALLLATWFLTRSRTAYLSVLVALSLWAICLVIATRRNQRRLNWKRLFVAGALAGLFVSMGVVWLVRNDRLVLSEAAKSLLFRLEYWQATVAMLRDHWSGIGFGNFQSYYPQYMLPTASETIADPHNWFLDIAVSFSLPVACLITGWLFFQFKKPLALLKQPTVAPELPAASAIDALLSKWLLLGAAVGGTFCLAANWLLMGIDIEGICLGWLIAIPLGLTMRGLIRELATQGSFVVRLAAGAMILCLLASGSWQATGIAVPWLVLLVCSTPRPPLVSAAGETNAAYFRSFGHLSTLALPVIGLIVFVFQSWMPTTRCWSLLQQATLANGLNNRLELATSAADADPLAAEPLHVIAQTLAWDAEQSGTKSQFDRKSQAAIEAMETWLEADAAKATSWQFAGDRLLKLAARCQELGQDPSSLLHKSLLHKSLLHKAQEYYAEASRRHPTSVGLHLQLAAVYGLMQDKTAALAELALAEMLSAQTPHADKKLYSQQIWLPSLPSTMPTLGESYVPAEPVAKWIRSL
jgi:hypothetical protein